jgi:hypothetical protein
LASTVQPAYSSKLDTGATSSSRVTPAADFLATKNDSTAPQVNHFIEDALTIYCLDSSES